MQSLKTKNIDWALSDINEIIYIYLYFVLFSVCVNLNDIGMLFNSKTISTLS